MLAGALAPAIGQAVIPLGTHLINTMFGGSLGPREDGAGRILGDDATLISNGTLRPRATRQHILPRDARFLQNAANAARRGGIFTEQQREGAHMEAAYGISRM